MFAIPLRGWQRVAVVALLTIPFTLVVAALLLPLALSVLLPKDRREYVLSLFRQLINWARVVAGVPPQPDELEFTEARQLPAPRHARN
jgi:hypothetical protein